MNAERLANAILDGEDPKEFLMRMSAERRSKYTYAKGFINAYIEAALWSSHDDEDRPMDDHYGPSDIAIETRGQMVDDCIKFFDANYDDISSDLARAGHDFWLTRNGHGAGFWDGDWPEDVGERLTAASKAFGEYVLYMGDDGQIYGA